MIFSTICDLAYVNNTSPFLIFATCVVDHRRNVIDTLHMIASYGTGEYPLKCPPPTKYDGKTMETHPRTQPHHRQPYRVLDNHFVRKHNPTLDVIRQICMTVPSTTHPIASLHFTSHHTPVSARPHTSPAHHPPSTWTALLTHKQENEATYI